MKRTLAWILAALMVLSMSACDQNNKETTSQSENTSVESTSTEAETNEEQPFEGTIIQLSDESITVDGEAIASDESAAVYVANDIVFYLEGQDFTYGEGTADDEHSQEEADKHTVVHIT